jgi:hypothetical protein
MSFNDIEERADLKAFKEFMDGFSRVLDMAVSRSEELFQKVVGKCSPTSSHRWCESDKYAPSFAIGLLSTNLPTRLAPKW